MLINSFFWVELEMGNCKIAWQQACTGSSVALWNFSFITLKNKVRLFCIQDLQKQIEAEPIAWKLTWDHKCDITQNHNVLLKNGTVVFAIQRINTQIKAIQWKLDNDLTANLKASIGRENQKYEESETAKQLYSD